MNDLRSIDLNLLPVLNALLEEVHVTRAAVRLGLSQPATSSALDRLRHLLRDPLLERGRGRMRLTPKAEALREPLRAALASVTTVLGTPETDLATIRRTVRLVMADHPAVTVTAALHERLATTAPGITLVVLPWHDAATALGKLADGKAELAASVLPPLDAAFHRTTLLDEHYLVAMRPGHPAAARFDLDQWLAYPHILVSASGAMATPLDARLRELGRARRVGAVLPSFLMVPPLLVRSDMIALLPSGCVSLGVSLDGAAALVTFPPPIAVEGFRLDLAWHARRHGDAVVRHVADGMVAVLRQGLVAG